MIDRDLYFYMNAPTPYRRHMFEMYAKEFRHALFHFYQRTTDHPTWTLDSSDWAIDYVYENPEDKIGFGRFKFTKRMLKRFFTQRRGSVYIGSMLTWGDSLLVNILGFLRLAIVIHINDAGFGERISRWQRFKNRINNFGVSAVLSPGKKGREYSKALGFRDEQIINCYFSHDIEKFTEFGLSKGKTARSEIRKRLGIGNGKVVVLTVSRWLCWKRLEDAYSSLSLLEENNPELADNIEYVLIGQGEWKEYLPLEKDLKRIKVHRFGDFSPDEIMGYYCAADILLFPSEGDIWGLVVNEALSLGLPVVCTNVIGAAELVENGVNGFVVPPRAPKELAKVVAKIASDHELRERMGNAARDRIKDWNTRRGLENLKTFLEAK